MRNSPLFTRPSLPFIGCPQPALAPAVVVQVVDIICPLPRALDFMSDAQQWLPWAMPALQSMQPLPFGQWLLTTAGCLQKLRLRTSSTLGLLTYELVDPAAGTWPVPVHMVPTDTGCQLVITFRQPAHMLLEAFETCIRNTIKGLGMLKLVLEQD
ncbi:MAG: hypothetical protein ACRYF0_21730 [Janthinobacterium lividum]